MIVPGAPGTELMDSKPGQRVWPSAWLMAYPMDGNDRLALPLDDPESTSIVAGKLLREIRVGRLDSPSTSTTGWSRGCKRWAIAGGLAGAYRGG